MIAPRPEIERWKDTLAGYVDVHYHTDAEHNVRIRHAWPQILVLEEMFEEIKRRAKVRASWKDITLMAVGGGVRIFAKPKKIAGEFTLGIYAGEIFMEADLWPPSYIRYMTDEFWITLAKLCEKTRVSWFTNQFPNGYNENKVNVTLYKHEKSVFFSIMRNYLIAAQLEKDTEGMGDFNWKWDMQGDWNAMLDEAAVAVQCVYDMNYRLWRWHYQTTYKWLKKWAKKEGWDFQTALKQQFPDD